MIMLSGSFEFPAPASLEGVTNIFGYGAGAQPFGSNGPVQFDAQQGRLNAFKYFQSNGLTSPPDPLTRPATETAIAYGE